MLLRRGGCLYLTTPNFDSLSRRIMGPNWRAIEYPEHLNLFTARSLDRLLVSAGLSRVEVHTTGLSPTDISAGLGAARAKPSGTGGAAGGHGRAASADCRVRARVASSPVLERAIHVVNAALSWLRLGDTIKALYRLP